VQSFSSVPDTLWVSQGKEAQLLIPLGEGAASAEKEEVRPSSPKYDERTFFYTTPQVSVPSPAAKPRGPWDSLASRGAPQTIAKDRSPSTAKRKAPLGKVQYGSTALCPFMYTKQMLRTP